jgi:alkylhydroperoxidase/carboxymuconolactone decarboxylase family protein YurZ
MLCIAMLVALNRGHQLRLHISGAISIEEIRKFFFQRCSAKPRMSP